MCLLLHIKIWGNGHLYERTSKRCTSIPTKYLKNDNNSNDNDNDDKEKQKKENKNKKIITSELITIMMLIIKIKK